MTARAALFSRSRPVQFKTGLIAVEEFVSVIALLSRVVRPS
jgi:hypothetical protein